MKCMPASVIPLPFWILSCVNGFNVAPRLLHAVRDDSWSSALSSANPSSFHLNDWMSDDVSAAINDDPSDVEIEDSSVFSDIFGPKMSMDMFANREYPFALMMQGSAPYIANHAGMTAVFHLPGEHFDTNHADSVISDIALARLLGMKIILVVGCRYDSDSCSIDFDHPSECHNFLKVTDRDALRHLEEEAGFLRTEVERKFNRCLRMHGGVSVHGAVGNIVSGNFFTAQKYGMVGGQDFEYAGFTKAVHTHLIQKVSENNDIVLLTTVGTTAEGELVSVNGYHLSAAVAAALGAYKLIYFAHEGSVLCEKPINGKRRLIQELPLTFARAITDYHGVSVFKKGFATFDSDKVHAPRSIEMLLHLAWASWAVEHGVTRAHVVNPTDGALLEELFTSKNGANTCLYHDSEQQKNTETEDDFDMDNEEWHRIFPYVVAQQGQRVSKV